jgi:nucleoside-diphosphate-sugar epimerase
MTVGVIGASGYLGQYVTDELLERGRSVVAFDIDPSDALADRAAGTDQLAISRGDMTTFADLSALVTEHDVDELVHLAYFGGSSPGLLEPAGNNPFTASNTNVTGFNNVLEVGRQFDLETVVCAGSTVVYGERAFYDELGIETVDEDSPLEPTTVYGACKLHNEHIARKYRQTYDLDVTCIRLPLIYGPERYGGAAPFLVDLFETAAEGGEMTVEEGDRTWDLLYERDIGPLFASVLERGTFPDTAYNVIGHSVSSRELATLAEQYGHPETDMTVSSGDSSEIPPVDDTLFRGTFEFRPQFDAEQAAADYLNSARSK